MESTQHGRPFSCSSGLALSFMYRQRPLLLLLRLLGQLLLRLPLPCGRCRRATRRSQLGGPGPESHEGGDELEVAAQWPGVLPNVWGARWVSA